MGIFIFAIGVSVLVVIVVLWNKLQKKSEMFEYSEKRFDELLLKNKELKNEIIEQKQITLQELESLKKERRDFESKRNSILTEIELDKHKAERELENLASKRSEMNREMAYKEEKLKQTYLRMEMDCNLKMVEIQDAMSCKTPFSHVADMISDFKIALYDDVEKYLRTKRPPAQKAADTVREMRNKSKSILYQYKQMYYKYTFLLDVFPELKNYVDDEETLSHVSDFKDYDEFSKEQDRVREWLSDEEYNSLSEDERNQLALDRYKNRSNKTNWEVGMEYELYIGYLLKQKGYTITQYGIKHGLHDLGRDIIAEKSYLNGKRVVYIIQCKRWAANKELHENTICQLYGTKVEYELQHRHFMNTEFRPLLVTSAHVSDMAQRFADKLGVIIKKEIEIGDYPMIKCNKDSMIYHLPFDQQYYTTNINEAQGEFYAWTVKEAVAKGYRRAKKWNGNNNQNTNNS